MPATRSPLSTAAAKALLRRRIATRRADLVAAGAVVAAPLRLVDGGIALWRGLPTLGRLALTTAGALAVGRLLGQPRGRAMLWRLVPLLLGVLRRTPAVRP